MQAIVQLPFANVKRLAAAAQQADPNEQELTPADEVILHTCPQGSSNCSRSICY